LEDLKRYRLVRTGAALMVKGARPDLTFEEIEKILEEIEAKCDLSSPEGIGCLAEEVERLREHGGG